MPNRSKAYRLLLKQAAFPEVSQVKVGSNNRLLYLPSREHSKKTDPLDLCSYAYHTTSMLAVGPECKCCDQTRRSWLFVVASRRNEWKPTVRLWAFSRSEDTQVTGKSFWLKLEDHERKFSLWLAQSWSDSRRSLHSLRIGPKQFHALNAFTSLGHHAYADLPSAINKPVVGSTRYWISTTGRTTTTTTTSNKKQNQKKQREWWLRGWEDPASAHQVHAQQLHFNNKKNRKQK